jgi:hypothetical protein
MTGCSKTDEPLDGPECPTPGCDGHMADVHPIETARSEPFILIRIQCPKCHARAWRILRQSEPKPRG